MAKIINANKGVVIIFALLVSTIFLSISLGISNIALKELRFSISGRDTNEALFAADAGIECALFYDRLNRFLYPDPLTPNPPNPPGTINCAGSTFTPVLTSVSTNPYNIFYYEFIVPGIGPSGKGCSKVKIYKDYAPPAPPAAVTITSDGFNVGSPTCNSTAANAVVRQLQATY